MSAIAPGGTIGILGSGQLGRMLAVAAAQLGYRTHIYAPESGPACDVSSEFTQGDWYRSDLFGAFVSACDVVTYEFENVPFSPLEYIQDRVVLRPGVRALRISQSRIDEKSFVRDLGGRTAPFAVVNHVGDLPEALDKVGLPAIVKTNRMGYDGKGQVRIEADTNLAQAWHSIGRQVSIAEGFVRFDSEFSVILARGPDGASVTWPAIGNTHENGILRTSVAPAPGLDAAMAEEARALAVKIAEALDYVGVLAVEFFATAEGPVFNEMAPRVHNSGHWTIEGSVTSQFENHIRAICGLPLGDAGLAGSRVEMENLIGDEAEAWPALLGEAGVHLHLYGKHESRPGRKMGHVTRVIR
jgi:5-(carboxyamino)imidazole ribonucleotide synthase